MALRLRHAVMAVLLGWALLISAYLPPKPREPRTAEGTSRYSSLFRTLDAENGALRMLRQRENLLSAMSRTPRAAVTVWVDARIPRLWQTRLESLTDSLWTSARINTPQVRVGVAFAVDTSRRGGVVDYLLPAQPGDPCLAVVTYSPTRVWHAPGDRNSEDVLQNVPGPCVFYAAYGRPGPAVHAWLADGGAGFGVTRTARPGAVMDDVPARGDILRAYLAEPFDGWQGLACRRADAARCAEMVHRATLLRFAPSRTRIPGWVSSDPLALGFNADLWLGDLERKEGAAKFTRFWKSELPLDGAFSAAFGTSVGAWTAGWVKAYPQGDIRTLRPASVGVSIAGIVLLLAMSAGVAMRRQANE